MDKYPPDTCLPFAARYMIERWGNAQQVGIIVQRICRCGDMMSGSLDDGIENSCEVGVAAVRTNEAE